ncbi:hypothetical protein F4604DRAFT_1686993 [Suillus subluteus]|nr:hypothetical protein F4604DRAFT_1686993 [Suillus subluteus]
MSKRASTFAQESEAPDGHLFRPLHHLAYLDLAFADNDTDLAHDYLTIQFHTTFDFRSGSAHTLHSRRGKSGKRTRRFVAIMSPDISLNATTSHPPSLKIANAISDITTTLLNGVLPQVRDEWFNGCWKTVNLPPHLKRNNHLIPLLLSNVKTNQPVVTSALPLPSSSGSTPVLSALKNDTNRHAVHPSDIRAEINTATENLKCERQQGFVTFADAKTLFAAYCLPRGVIRELYACINEDTGFERENWQNVLAENLIDEPMQSSILMVIDKVRAVA